MNRVPGAQLAETVPATAASLTRLGLAGDWCLAGRAEAAFDSGTALAAALLG